MSLKGWRAGKKRRKLGFRCLCRYPYSITRLCCVWRCGAASGKGEGRKKNERVNRRHGLSGRDAVFSRAQPFPPARRRVRVRRRRAGNGSGTRATRRLLLRRRGTLPRRPDGSHCCDGAARASHRVLFTYPQARARRRPVMHSVRHPPGRGADGAVALSAPVPTARRKFLPALALKRMKIMTIKTRRACSTAAVEVHWCGCVCDGPGNAPRLRMRCVSCNAGSHV